MSERALRQLVGALAVVVVLGLVAALLRSGSGSIRATGDVEHVFDGVDSGSLEAVRIEHAGVTTTLSRGPEGWTVDGLRADSGAVARLLTAVDEMAIGDLAATNPANHARMGVSSDSATTVTFTAGRRERTILVGDSGRRFGTAYVRLPGADEVWILEGDLRAQLGRDADGWRDRVMTAIDTAAVARIVVERDGGSYALVRGDSAWTFDGGAGVAPTVVDGILAELAHMVATGFLTEGDSLAALPRAARTSALSGEGAVLAEVTFGQGDADRWARTSANDWIYRVSSFRANRVAPARETVAPAG